VSTLAEAVSDARRSLPVVRGEAQRASAVGGVLLAAAIGFLVSRSITDAMLLGLACLLFAGVALAGREFIVFGLVAALPWMVVFDSFTPTDVKTLTSAAAAIALIAYVGPIRPRSKALPWGLGLFLAAIAVGTALSVSGAQLIQAAKYMVFPAMCLAVTSERSRARLLPLCKPVLYSAALAMLVQIGIIAAGLGSVGTYYHIGENVGFDPQSPHELALMAVIVACGGLAAVRGTVSRAAFVALGIIPAVETGVRSALVASALVLVLYIASSRLGLRQVIVIGVSAVVIVGSGALAVAEARISTDVSGGEFSSLATAGSGRGAIWTTALRHYVNSGAEGIALGTGLRSITRFEQQDLGSAFVGHSDLIEVGVQLGIVGFLGWVIMWLTLFRDRTLSRLVLVPVLVYALINGSIESTAPLVVAMFLAVAASRTVELPVRERAESVTGRAGGRWRTSGVRGMTAASGLTTPQRAEGRGRDRQRRRAMRWAASERARRQVEPHGEDAAATGRAAGRRGKQAHPQRREDDTRTVEVAQRLERWCHQREWTGPDPYDGLNATRLPPAIRRSALGMRLMTQAVKRSPLDLRPVLGIRSARSAATMTYAISSYARNGFMDEEVAATRLEHTIDTLLGLRCTGYDEPCWGYHFDVQTHVFFYPRTEPNTIATAFAGHALLDAHELAGAPRALELAVGAADFFIRHVPQTEGAGGAYFGYLAGDRTPIHNASMLVCSLFARLARHVDRPELRTAATAAVGYTIAHQRPDGSWPYGELPHLDWIDNFHTGYVLDCLLACSEAGIGGDVDGAWQRGLDYYSRELFLADGTPKYKPDSVHPVDGQCVAQAMQTFALASRGIPTRLEDARRTFAYAMQTLARTDGSFAFQRRRLWVNRTPHLRWVQGPMLAALTHLIAAETTAA
jgi:O-Antigen ligase